MCVGLQLFFPNHIKLNASLQFSMHTELIYLLKNKSTENYKFWSFSARTSEFSNYLNFRFDNSEQAYELCIAAVIRSVPACFHILYLHEMLNIFVDEHEYLTASTWCDR